MKRSLISRIVKNARSMIQRALDGELEKPQLSQFPPAPEERVQHVFKTKTHPETHFDTQEADAFRMKAISLLNPYNFFSSIEEKITFLHLAPLEKERINEQNQITLSQVLLPFPGERIELKGKFQRHETRTIPVANSFELHRVSHVTGFPHPAQHTGWAFCEGFLSNKKNGLEEIRMQLLPGEPLRQKAKDWVGAKKRTFDKNSVELCDLLRLFIETLHGDSSPVIKAFFDHAASRQDSFDFISMTHGKILEFYRAGSCPIESTPYQTLIFTTLLQEPFHPKFKTCADLEFSLFIESLHKNPFDEAKMLKHFKDTINDEIRLLIDR